MSEKMRKMVGRVSNEFSRSLELDLEHWEQMMWWIPNFSEIAPFRAFFQFSV